MITWSGWGADYDKVGLVLSTMTNYDTWQLDL